jgi:single-stranded-DNA-specific exonuclease
MAAGFGLELTKLEIVTSRLKSLAKTKISPQLLKPEIEIECLLPLDLATVKTAQDLQKFAPFGQANPEPVFGFQKVQVLDALTMGQAAKHLKLIVADPAHPEQPINCIAWSSGHLVNQLKPGTLVNLAGTLNLNQWRGKISLQVMIKDLIINL